MGQELQLDMEYVKCYNCYRPQSQQTAPRCACYRHSTPSACVWYTERSARVVRVHIPGRGQQHSVCYGHGRPSTSVWTVQHFQITFDQSDRE